MFSRISLWIKDNKEMTLTIISGLFIILGLILSLSLPDWAWLAYALAMASGGYYSAKQAGSDLFKDHELNVDVLMILAALGAASIGHWSEGALLIFIFSLAESLEERAMARSQEAIAALMKMTPELARRYTSSGDIEEVPTADLQIGDRIQVRKGEAIPIDGELKSDIAIINEAAITGESLPVTKKQGESLIGGTINEEHTFDMWVTHLSQDTLFSKIVRMVDEAQANPSQTDTFIQNLENTYVKVVLVAVPLFIVLAPWLFAWTWSESFYRGMVLLTVASPCALVASAAPANLSAISRAAKEEILFKGGGKSGPSQST